jgi:hypothetical protein
MNCPNCNTRVRESDRSCPNCGRRVSAPKRSKGGVRARAKAGLAGLVSPSAMTSKSPDDSSTGAGIDEPEIELEDSMEIELEDPTDPGISGVAARSNDDSSTAGSTGSGGSGMPPPARIRRMVAEDPDLLEEGLRAYTDNKGVAVGVGFTTPVGKIDLLARDANESFVVVLVADLGREADLAAQILQRMGWVGKHLGRPKQTVRGVIIASEVPESLLYAAAALPDSVTIVTYRMALTFEPVEA